MRSFLILSLFLALLDQITKALVRRYIPLGGEVPIFSFFSLVHLENTGVAFGLFQGQNTFFLFLGLALSAGIVVCVFSSSVQKLLPPVPAAFIFGGALGNITDRIFRGAVTDFLDVFWKSYHWPAFNVADSLICVGAAVVVIKNLFGKGNK